MSRLPRVGEKGDIVSAASTTSPRASDASGDDAIQRTRIAIIGTGFSGLGMAIRLRQEGIEDFVVLEREDDVGGCWRDNTYPGLACDVPSNLYSFSFAPNPNWSRTFSPQQEILEYLRDCAWRFGVMGHIRFGTEVIGADWDDALAAWRIETTGGALLADVLIPCLGPLTEPLIPDLPGLSRFAGTMFHSARWDHEHDLAGERVAVIGTGASAIQFVPRIAPRVAQMHVFQRHAPWIIPRHDRDTTRVERALYRRLPITQKIVRETVYWLRETWVAGFRGNRALMRIPAGIARRHLARQVPDPALRAQLTPDYEFGCKRVLISNEYYRSFSRANVALVTDPIREVGEHSVTTADGTEHEVDTIVFGTGFHVTDASYADAIRGRDGLLLRTAWNGSPEAYMGVAVTGFPNLFLTVGPNSGLSHSSIVYMIEAQVEYILQALRALGDRSTATIEVRPQAQREYNERLQAMMPDTVWNSGGCGSYYIDANGRNSTLWPTYTFRYAQQMRHLRLADYDVRGPRPAPAPAPKARPPVPT